MSEPTFDVTHLRPLSCLWARVRVGGCSCRSQMRFHPPHLLPFSFSSGQDISITWQGPTQEVKNNFVFFLNANFDTRQRQKQRQRQRQRQWQSQTETETEAETETDRELQQPWFQTQLSAMIQIPTTFSMCMCVLWFPLFAAAGWDTKRILLSRVSGLQFCETRRS